MKNGHVIALLLGVLVLTVSGFTLAEESAQTTVEGWVETWEENEDGEILSVYIDVDGTWYVVESDGEGPELLDYVGQQVRATGTVTADPEDSSLMRISVKSFSAVEEEETQDDPYTDPEPTGRH